MSKCSCGADTIDDYLCKIVKTEQLTEKIFWLTLLCPELAERARPGNCVMLFASEGGLDPFLGRPFAVADTDPARGEISLCLSVAGRGTRLLSEKLPGEKVRVRGLFGIPLPEASGVYLLSGGVGAAIFLLYNKLRADGVSGFYLGIPGRGYEKFADKIKELVPDAKIFTDDGSYGDGDSMFKALPRRLEAGQSAWACGPDGFFRAARRHFEASPDKLWFSLENRMACGYGGCMGCVVETKEGLKRVCVDKSLFLADEVDLYEES